MVVLVDILRVEANEDEKTLVVVRKWVQWNEEKHWSGHACS